MSIKSTKKEAEVKTDVESLERFDCADYFGISSRKASRRCHLSQSTQVILENHTVNQHTKVKNVCMYVSMYVCTYVRMHACMHVCMYALMYVMYVMYVCNVCNECNVCNVCTVCKVCKVCNVCNVCNVM